MKASKVNSSAATKYSCCGNVRSTAHPCHLCRWFTPGMLQSTMGSPWVEGTLYFRRCWSMWRHLRYNDLCVPLCSGSWFLFTCICNLSVPIQLLLVTLNKKKLDKCTGCFFMMHQRWRCCISIWCGHMPMFGQLYGIQVQVVSCKPLSMVSVCSQGPPVVWLYAAQTCSVALLR